eukprot:365747-Chlamydomonas_euryale.AAC.56
MATGAAHMMQTYTRWPCPRSGAWCAIVNAPRRCCAPGGRRAGCWAAALRTCPLQTRASDPSLLPKPFGRSTSAARPPGSTARIHRAPSSKPCAGKPGTKSYQ